MYVQSVIILLAVAVDVGLGLGSIRQAYLEFVGVMPHCAFGGRHLAFRRALCPTT